MTLCRLCIVNWQACSRFPSPIPIELPAVLTYSAEAAEEHYTEKAEAGRFARGCSHGNITPSVSFYSGSEAVCIYQSQTAPLLQGVLLCQAAFCQPDTESMLIAAALAAINADAEVLRLAVRKLYPARYGRAEDVVIVSLSSRTQQVLAIRNAELDTKLVTAG
ncbi:TPA: hypothetical protein ACH3X3_003920 [Trebouxia sp. C0006]